MDPLITTGEVKRDSLVELEAFIRTKRHLPALRKLIGRFGTEVLVTRRRISSQGEAATQTALDVYGLYSGLSGDKPSRRDINPTADISFTAIVLINAQTYRFADNRFANDFETLYSWTEADILPLDIITFLRLQDSLNYTFQVTSSEVFGHTMSVMRRLVLASAPENITHPETLISP